MPAQKKLISLLLIILLLVSLFLTLILVSKRQEIRKRAASSWVTLALYPATENIPLGQERAFELKATFTDGSETEKIDYFKTEIILSKEYLRVPADKYVVTSFTTNQTNFSKIFRVDGPYAANDSGKIIIELGATIPGGGPSTNNVLTIARVYFEGAAQTPSSQTLAIGTTEVVNNQSVVIPSTSQATRYTVGSAFAVSSVPTISGPWPTDQAPSPSSKPLPPTYDITVKSERYWRGGRVKFTWPEIPNISSVISRIYIYRWDGRPPAPDVTTERYSRRYVRNSTSTSFTDDVSRYKDYYYRFCPQLRVNEQLVCSDVIGIRGGVIFEQKIQVTLPFVPRPVLGVSIDSKTNSLGKILEFIFGERE